MAARILLKAPIPREGWTLGFCSSPPQRGRYSNDCCHSTSGLDYVRCERKTEYWYIHLRLDVLQVRIGNSKYIIIILIFLVFTWLLSLGQFIGSIIPLASDRFGESFFDCDEFRKGSAPPSHLEAFRKVGVLTGVNQAMQCETLAWYGWWLTLAYYLSGLGSILVAPLIQRYQTRKVLLGATVAFALLASILIIVDGECPLPWKRHPLMMPAATGGRPRQWGQYNPVAIFP